jgi:hypothetical protein
VLLGQVVVGSVPAVRERGDSRCVELACVVQQSGLPDGAASTSSATIAHGSSASEIRWQDPSSVHDPRAGRDYSPAPRKCLPGQDRTCRVVTDKAGLQLRLRILTGHGRVGLRHAELTHGT